MCKRLFVLLALCSISSAAAPKSEARVRQIILSTRHLGAHLTLGYNEDSLWQLSKKLSSADIPILISLASGDSDLRVGAQFALASQCGAAITPVRATAAKSMRFLDLSANDTLQLMSEFDGCSPEVREQASAARADLQRILQEQNARIELEVKQKADEDARIQANGIKLLDPEKAKALTREERLEIYHRSLAAMGIKEDGPMTPDQKKLADRMYRSMVLDEAKTPPN
jgi:hypothetical protein